MKRMIVAFTLLLTLISATTLQAATLPATQQQNDLNNIVITTANVLNATTNAVEGTFTGVFDITRFVVRNGQLFATGTLNGTINTAAGGVINIVNQVVNVLVNPGNATCEILELNLGPLHLDLLGLVVDLSAVDLTITAEQGPGNLLGNLLCAVAGLLDRGGPLSGIAGLLNNILRVLSR